MVIITLTLMVIATFWAPFLISLIKAMLCKWCPPYRRWQGERISRKFTELRKKQKHWEACRFAERYFTVADLVRDRAYAGFGLNWAKSAGQAYDPKALLLAERVGMSGYYEAEAHEVAGSICVNAGKAVEAERHYRLANEHYRADGDSAGISRVLVRTAILDARDGRFEEAHERCRLASGTHSSTSIPITIIEAHIHFYRGQYADAQSLLTQAINEQEDGGNPGL